MNIFLAGATGVIGSRLVDLLGRDGHAVTGTTRSASKAERLRERGATPVVVDVFDAAALTEAVAAARPEVVIHQLTDLPDIYDPARADAISERNARLRIDGTRHLMEAARAAGVRRAVAQSIAWVYAPGDAAHLETDPLDHAPTGTRALTVQAVATLESLTLGTPGIEGIVLRYGRLYGAGTWTEAAAGPAPLHVDAAAQAARLAVTRGEAGIYNVVEEDGAVSAAKARRLLGFDADFRM
jgi:nucleoside-diphosphate-sugar epimerase